MPEQAEEILVRHFEESLIELLEHYMSVRPVKMSSQSLLGSSSRVASVGFGEERFRGSAVLFTNNAEEFAKACTETQDASDWLGELGNQLVGRFKNKMVEYGSVMNLGLPVILRGGELLFEGDAAGQWQLNHGELQLTTFIKLEIEQGLELVHDESNKVAEEGSLCLF